MMKCSCTRCGSERLGTWCINCDENPYDKIKSLQADLEALKEENKVLKLTVEHYKSDKNVKF